MVGSRGKRRGGFGQRALDLPRRGGHQGAGRRSGVGGRGRISGRGRRPRGTGATHHVGNTQDFGSSSKKFKYDQGRGFNMPEHGRKEDLECSDESGSEEESTPYTELLSVFSGDNRKDKQLQIVSESEDESSTEEEINQNNPESENSESDLDDHEAEIVLKTSSEAIDNQEPVGKVAVLEILFKLYSRWLQLEFASWLSLFWFSNPRSLRRAENQLRKRTRSGATRPTPTLIYSKQETRMQLLKMVRV